MDPESRPPVKSRLAFHLTGHLAADDFPDWMAHHAQKLGVTFEITRHTAHRMDITASGATEMLHAFALACSLGPKSVCIDALHITETPN